MQNHRNPIKSYEIPNKNLFKKNSVNIDELKEISNRVGTIVSNNAALEDKNTNPGIVVTDDSGLPIELYWSAVQGVVELEMIKRQVSFENAIFKGFKKERGIIGAAAAIAWGSKVYHNKDISNNSEIDYTFELITYREPSQWGTKRQINPEAVLALDNNFPSTFNNFDCETDHIAISPNSPCPVLYGVRGEDSRDLINVLSYLKPYAESIDKWVIFKTNQATDDHLVPTNIKNIVKYSSVTVTGSVLDQAKTIPGGHVLIELKEHNFDTNYKNEYDVLYEGKINNNPNFQYDKNPTTITCAAYEPTKSFRNVLRYLIPGDIVSVSGGLRTNPRSINLEKIEIHHLEKHSIKLHNPTCSKCGRAMKSIGREKGFRCKKCHIKLPLDCVKTTQVQRKLRLGYYEVPVSARRHLSKPLKRCKNLSGLINKIPKTF